ncbi:DNA polymerase III subunit psi [Thaumasiovibrio sp. DFM-14]|uniref:DNA polymerase III subunit psi n=1 Tax=Thaumasiovibrio sp. DFM-14 TaxID=3384792 RepID=UPI0039A3CF55
MTLTADQRLTAMGLQRWQLRHPHYYSQYRPTLIDLPASCRLLFVCDEPLNEHDGWLFGRILASMKLSPEQALQLSSQALEQLGEHQLTWCWFAGCSGTAPAGVNVLTSVSLAQMAQQPAHKKQLWQQICGYEK